MQIYQHLRASLKTILQTTNINPHLKKLSSCFAWVTIFFTYKIGIRHVQTFLMGLGMVFGYFLRVNIAVAIVPMTSKDENPTSTTYDWSTVTKSLILSSFFWGYVVAQVPSGLLAKRYGAKIVLGLATLICGIITLLHPIAVTLGNWQTLCALRILTGLTQGVVYPCIHTLLAKWMPCTERGFLGTAVYSGAQLGTTIFLAASGVIIESSGWTGIFYVSGGTATLWAVIFLYYGADEPSTCKSISKYECEYIESLTGVSSTGNEPLPIPWKSFFTSPPFIALIFAQSGFSWGFYTLLTEIPLYMSEVLQLNVKSNALLSALPYFVMWLLCLIISPISDWVINHKIISVTAARKVFNTIGQWIPMACLLGLAYMTAEQATLAVVLLTLGVGFNAASFCGYLVNHMDLSPNFAGPMMGISNGIANLLSIFAPLTVGAIVKHEDDPAEWRIIFFITAGMYLLCNAMFIFFGQATIQPWNEPPSVDVFSLHNQVMENSKRGSTTKTEISNEHRNAF